MINCPHIHGYPLSLPACASFPFVVPSWKVSGTHSLCFYMKYNAFLIYRILGFDKIVFPLHFKYVIPLSSEFHYFCWNVHCQSYGFFFEVKWFLSLLSSLMMIYLVVVPFAFVLTEVTGLLDSVPWWFSPLWGSSPIQFSPPFLHFRIFFTDLHSSSFILICS